VPMTREQRVSELAEVLKEAIKNTQTQACCYGEFERPDVVGHTLIGFDGYFDLHVLADTILDHVWRM